MLHGEVAGEAKSAGWRAEFPGHASWLGRPASIPEKTAAATDRELAASRRHSLIGGHGSRFYQQPTRAVTAVEQSPVAIIRPVAWLRQDSSLPHWPGTNSGGETREKDEGIVTGLGSEALLEFETILPGSRRILFGRRRIKRDPSGMRGQGIALRGRMGNFGCGCEPSPAANLRPGSATRPDSSQGIDQCLVQYAGFFELWL
jgi:hypothetical protein